MKKLISIIVPVYNVETYLEKCVNSIINQTYKNLEVILIDDGSTDSSGIICDEIARKDSRIKVIHKKNFGVSAARNLGLDNANGEYIGFVDSDDWIEPNMYELLYREIEENNSDIAICDVFLEKEFIEVHKVISQNKNIFNKDEIFEMLLDNNGFNWLCNKLFKKDLFNDVRIDPRIHMGEDILCVCQCISKGSTFTYISEPLYHYLIREDSACNDKFNIKKVTNIDAYKKILNIYSYNSPINLWKAINSYILSNILVSNWMISSGKYDRNLIKQINNNINNILKEKDKKITNNIKIKILLFKINPQLLYRITKIINAMKKAL